MSHVIHVLLLPVRALVWAADSVMFLCQCLMIGWLLGMAAIALVLVIIRFARTFRSWRVLRQSTKLGRVVSSHGSSAVSSPSGVPALLPVAQLSASGAARAL